MNHWKLLESIDKKDFTWKKSEKESISLDNNKIVENTQGGVTEWDVLDAVEKLSEKDDISYNDIEAIEFNSPTILLTPSGYILNATDYDTHSDFIDAVFRHITKRSDYDDWYNNDAYDYVVKELGFITLNTGDGFSDDRCKVVIFDRPTSKQINLLREWLEKRIKEEKPIILYVSGRQKTYFPEDENYDAGMIIKAIQKSFVSGVLESVDTEKDSDGNLLTSEQISFFKNSKVRDEKGNLLVLYHGTRKGGFTEFDSTKNHAYIGTNFGKVNVNFFTTSFNNAKGYSWSKDKNKPGETMNYVVYVNIENPLVIDAKGEFYTGIKRDNIKERKLKDLEYFYNKWVNSRFYDLELSSDAQGVKEFKKDLARIGYELEYSEDDESYMLRGMSGGFGSAFVSGYALSTIEDVIEYAFDGGEQLKPHDENITGSESTNDIIRDTIENHPEYDGIIFNSIVDSVDGWGELGTTVVTLKSANQIKSVDNKTPTSSNNINEDINKIISYHGSQTDDLKLTEKNFYATSSKELAKKFALGYNFAGDLVEEDVPTVYTVELTINNPKVINTEDEYDEFMEITALEFAKNNLIKNGFDGIIFYAENEDLIYYVVFNAKKQVKIINKEIVTL